ncbi:hypothetical protein OJF2_12850 [Aquisphaera giovannonii]|uniref:Uncharacterized protein n=1 Tax=Aquisphaera giovannonii TaxID=406548 RepID=A0A5B9VY18_9BACT|nr:hypothetical protein [Aquisphaera giovannonii]QEH32801.1 hypothetical protein OJF2_12850 [Aquisphaera giovannonii]
MSPAEPLPRLPYVLLIAMTAVSFGGPFVMLAAVRGGPNAGWPPDRPVEWVAIAAVMILFLGLFAACVSLGAWHRPRPRPSPRSRD